MSEAGVRQFLSEILPVMEYIHSCQVIHRDIKPANLIRRSHDKKLVLIDFGAVKNNVASLVENSSEQTAFTSYAIGTPGFAPPEQMAMRPVFASDIYALGVTCIYLLAGKSPKDLSYDPSTGELMWRKYVTVTDHFASVIQKMLEVSVRHRYQNAKEIYQALDMEPYMESLANSMNSVSTRTTQPPQETKPEEPASMTPMQRAAMSIRSRQGKSSDSTSLQAGSLRQQQVVASRPSALGVKTGDHSQGDRSMGSIGRTSGSVGRPSMGDRVPTQRKMTADDLLDAYEQGRRDFAACDCESVRLTRVDLSGATFHSANLKHVNLNNSVLSGADFGRANLGHAKLRDTNLTKAYLSNADLQEADLRGADLRGAYLLNANLRGTNLCGANLTGAKLAPEQLAMAKTNWMTIKPNGKR
jgi:serine/threonine protein kinase, bacterial